MKTATFVSLGLILLLSSACRFEIKSSNGTELKGEGITFLVPTESSSSSSGSGGISYNGSFVKAKTDGKRLTVNGKDYGPLAKGDVVNLREKGVIMVNGSPRKPVGSGKP